MILRYVFDNEIKVFKIEILFNRTFVYARLGSQDQIGIVRSIEDIIVQ